MQKQFVNSSFFHARLCKKDKWAFSLLYDTYSAALYGWIENILVEHKELASQILNDVFLMVWNTISSYDRRNQKLFIWMLNITKSMTVAAMQRLDKWPSSTTLDDIATGLRKILPHLEDGPRQVFELMYYKEYTKAETALALNISVETADKLYKAALMQLQIYLTSNL
ncbi:MAG: hypothetical protein J7621_23315 [Niastella sp.]|nr:hypothetical protein [Niastella sp.]